MTVSSTNNNSHPVLYATAAGLTGLGVGGGIALNNTKVSQEAIDKNVDKFLKNAVGIKKGAEATPEVQELLKKTVKTFIDNEEADHVSFKVDGKENEKISKSLTDIVKNTRKHINEFLEKAKKPGLFKEDTKFFEGMTSKLEKYAKLDIYGGRVAKQGLIGLGLGIAVGIGASLLGKKESEAKKEA